MMMYEEPTMELILQYGWPLIFFIPLGMVYELALGLMVWEDIGVF